MRETPAPRHLQEFVEEMVEVGVQLATMLDHMYRFQAAAPDANQTPPPEVLRDLVAKTLQRSFRTSRRDIARATNLLRLSSRTIADQLMLVEPGAFDDLTEDDFCDHDGCDCNFEDFPFDPPAEANGSHLN